MNPPINGVRLENSMDQTQRCRETTGVLRMVFVIALGVGCLPGAESTVRCDDAATDPQTTARVKFETDVAPILRDKCIDCHGPDMQLADLRLDRRQFAIVDGEARDLIKPGDSAGSLLIQRLVDKDLGLIMPPSFPFFPEEKPGLPESQIELLKRWIDEGADWPEGVVLSEEPAATQSPEAKALFAAIRAADAASVTRILEDRSLSNAVDQHGATPLMHAALYADAPITRLLMERGADINAADKSGTTALMLAAGDPDKVRVLLDHGARVDAHTRIGRTPLLIACTYTDNADVVRQFLKAGASVEDRDLFGETAVTSASKCGGTELLELLIAAGADARGGGGFRGQPPLVWAAAAGKIDTINCLLRHGADRDADALNAGLFEASVRGHVDVVRLLLEHAADPSAACGFARYTPLMGAAYSDGLNTDIVRMLLQSGANVHWKAANGETALSLARKHGHTEIVDLLTQAGAKE
jgi:ankyrin repeat protein